MSSPIGGPRLNFPLIRSRAASLGLPSASLSRLLGVRLEDLEGGFDERFISLAVLVRLADVLNLTLDQLVVLRGPMTAPPPERAVGDDAMVLALVASYSGITVERVLTLLSWTSIRLEAALASLHEQLAGSPLRLVVTDSRLAIVLRSGVLPEDTRERLDHEQRQREPLQAPDAVDLLALVTDKILKPFSRRERSPAQEEWDRDRALHLAGLGLAVPISADTNDFDVEPHPDILFALRLAP